MTSESSAQELTPWYRQFWPWFIFALPATVVVAGIVTVFIAIDGADHLVTDDYYRQGLGINRLLAQDQAATSLAVAAELSLDDVLGELHLQLQGQFSSYPDQLTLLWAHPADQALDFAITLQKTARNEEGTASYVAELTQRVSGRWYLQLSAAQPQPWRLKQAVLIKSDMADDSPQQFLLAAKGED
ncbi:FixH family protein [Oceanicoccus sp. KOV_DT_Chl]|uniref:FixH family protein n=1 Tax=Oceanicoccus sp. KOV_DT_Chl TaxID=1904639 RepID=UPI001357CB7D|nr:FixH family protein [Oceanicoccus sp. KOV_DT_Chl]